MKLHLEPRSGRPRGPRRLAPIVLGAVFAVTWMMATSSSVAADPDRHGDRVAATQKDRDPSPDRDQPRRIDRDREASASEASAAPVPAPVSPPATPAVAPVAAAASRAAATVPETVALSPAHAPSSPPWAAPVAVPAPPRSQPGAPALLAPAISVVPATAGPLPVNAVSDALPVLAAVLVIACLGVVAATRSR